MSVFGGRKSANIQPDFSGLAIQTATAAAAIPIVYGITRTAPNVIWRDGVRANPQGSGGGKGGGGGATSYDYTCWIMFSIGEGPIFSVNRIYNGQSVFSYGAYNLTTITGTTPQTPWAPAVTSYPAAALAYNGTAYMASSYFDLGSSASIPSISFEVYGRFATTSLVNTLDADTTNCILDFLTNPQYGVGFPQGSIDVTTLGGTSGDASYRSYCQAVGLAFSPVLVDQEAANSVLARWLQITNTAALWSGGKLKFIPYGDTAITTAPNTIVQPYQIASPASAESDGGLVGVLTSLSTAATYRPVPVARFVADAGVTYASTGAALTKVATPPTQGQYTATNGTYGFSILDAGQNVQIAYSFVPAGAYTPNLTPVYDLGDDDFVHEEGNDPVEVVRLDPYGVPNVQRLEVFDRSKQYAATPVEARDQSAIEQFGLRVGSTVTAHEICDLGIGIMAAQLILQRALYIRNTYSFKLSWEYCLLEPMDLVALTDPGLGLAGTMVRITAIEEDEGGLLAITAEEFPGSTATAATVAPTISPVTLIDRNVAPSAVNPPVILEAPSPLTGGEPQLWAVVSGGANDVADPNWGGCNVFISSDGTTYNQVGTLSAGGRQGVLTAVLPVPSGANPDTASTLAVDLGESGGTLMSGSQADAQNAVTLCLVDRELVAYQTATLTASNRYTLTYLQRGLYGSTPMTHAVGAPFARLDSSTFKYPLPPAMIGATPSLKFQSFNIYGGGLQDISTCVAYPVTTVGSGMFGPTAQEIATGTSFDEGLASQAVTQSDDYGLASDPYTQPVDEGLASELVQSLAVASGGTGATSPAGARAALGAAASGVNADITSITGLTTALSLAQGGSGATTAAGARGNLGAAAAGANSDITALSGLTTALSVSQGGTGATTASAARAALGAAASSQNSDITSLLAIAKIAGAASGPQAITIDPSTGHVGLGGYTADGNNGVGALGTSFLFNAAVDSCRFTFNKMASANDASLTFETNYSPRALAGLLGSDGYQLKVSPDGSTFHQVYVVDQTTGNAAFKALLSLASYAVSALPAGLNGALAFASNGRKLGEAAGAGTGVVAAFSNGQWRRLSDDAAVAA